MSTSAPSSSSPRSSRSVAVSLGLLAVLLLGCQPASPRQHETAAAVVSKPAGSPLTGLETPTADARELSGVVAERLAAGSYSYLRIEGEQGSHWIATTGPGAELGEHVRVRSMGTRHDFESPRLGRRFDELVFGFVEPGTTTATEKT